MKPQHAKVFPIHNKTLSSFHMNHFLIINEVEMVLSLSYLSIQLLWHWMFSFLWTYGISHTSIILGTNVYYCISTFLSCSLQDSIGVTLSKVSHWESNDKSLYLSQSLHFSYSYCAFLLSNVEKRIVNCCISAFLLQSPKTIVNCCISNFLLSSQRLLRSWLCSKVSIYMTTFSFFNFLSPTRDLSNKDWIHSMTRKWKTSR